MTDAGDADEMTEVTGLLDGRTVRGHRSPDSGRAIKKAAFLSGLFRANMILLKPCDYAALVFTGGWRGSS